MTETQAVATDSKEQGNPVPAETSAQVNNDLDALLEEFDSPPKSESETAKELNKEVEDKPEQDKAEAEGDKPKDKAPSGLDQDTQLALKYAKTQFQETIKRETDKAVEDATKVVKGDLKVPDVAAKAYLHMLADEDVRFRSAFMQRKSNPEAWNKILGAVHQKFAKEFTSSSDPDLTKKRDSVLSAVRSAGNQAATAEDVNLGQMNDAELAAYKKSLTRK
jgi:hypothetical protein